MRRILLLALPLLALVACSRSPQATSDESSVLVVTFGASPASAFGAAEPGAPSMTPVFDGFKTTHTYNAIPEMAPSAAEAATLLLGDGALPASYRKRGYRTAAFLADPTLAPLTESFDAHLDPTLAPHPGASASPLIPRPFEQLDDEQFHRGAFVIRKALEWVASEANIPSDELSEAPRKSGRKAPKKSPTQGTLQKPIFLWIHLADPIFRNSPGHVHLGGAAKATRLQASVATMDLHLGHLIGFLSEHGLRENVNIALIGLTADVPGGSVPTLLPADDLGLTLHAPTAAIPTEQTLPRRLRWADPADTNLLADCQAYRDAHPDSPEAWGWLGVAQTVAKCAPTEALASHQKASELDPKNPFRTSNLGLAYLGTGDVVKAIDLLENAYLAAPKNPRYKANLTSVLLNVGIAFSEQEQFDNAMACLTRVTFLQPNNPYGYFALGRLHEKMGQPQMASGFYQKTLSLQPKFKPAHEALRALEMKKAPIAP